MCNDLECRFPKLAIFGICIESSLASEEEERKALGKIFRLEPGQWRGTRGLSETHGCKPWTTTRPGAGTRWVWVLVLGFWGAWSRLRVGSIVVVCFVPISPRSKLSHFHPQTAPFNKRPPSVSNRFGIFGPTPISKQRVSYGDNFLIVRVFFFN